MKTKKILEFILLLFISMFNLVMLFLAAGEIDRLWVLTNTLSSILGFSFVGLWLVNTIYLFKNILWKRK
jgi:hypothetical protein